MWKQENRKQENDNIISDTPGALNNPIESSKTGALIGALITIKGEMTGEEDLVIHGHVEGKITLKKHRVTVGKKGKVKADIYGKIISIEGELQGNLFGEERIVIRQSGVVNGNLIAPRVTLEDGAKFKGSIDMDSQDQDKQKSLPSNQPKNQVESINTQKTTSTGNVKQNVSLDLGAQPSTSSSEK